MNANQMKQPSMSSPRRRRGTLVRTVLGAAVLLAGTSAALAAGGKANYNGFQVNNATIPVEEIRRGGPPRDGIPAIDRPRFVRPAQARFMEPDDLVLSVTLGHETRAYPLRILVWHEIVNDKIGDTPVAVTYCPLCGTAMAFQRKIHGRTLSFGVSGLLYQSDVLMYDRQTESLWSQLAMHSVAGPQVGTKLDWLPTEHVTWAAWKAAHRDGKVLSTQTGHRRDYTRHPYTRYEQSPNTMFPVPAHRTELPVKAWVIGVLDGAQARAYPVEALAEHPEVTDAGGAVRLQYHPETRAARVTDAGGSELPHVFVYWFAWQAFYPETTLWRP